ncbi:MAG: response regulator [Nitrospiraceae bacterium]|nr:response regulator [Nitrospiraceae bacterium]
MDDDYSLLRECIEFFQKKGFDVSGASDVEDALACLRDSAYDVAIIDLRLKVEFDGFTIIDEIKSSNYLTQIVVMTGLGNLEVARKLIRRGVADFIEKSSDLLEKLLKSVEESIEHKRELERSRSNPFVNRSGEIPKVFGGRNAELDFLESTIDKAINRSSAQHFVVLGQSCMGKTVLLREFKRLAQTRGCLAAYVPMVRISSNDEFAMTGAEVIVQGIFYDIPHSVERLKGFWGYLESLGVSVMGTGFNFTKSRTKELPPHFFLSETLKRLWGDLNKERGLILVLVDDVDYIVDSQPNALIFLKQALNMLDYQKTKFLFVLASSGKNWERFISQASFKSVGTYFSSRRKLQPLSQKETEELIQDSLQGTGVVFRSFISQQIWKCTLGHPFLIQVLCYNLFDSQVNGIVDRNAWDKSYRKSINQVGDTMYQSLLQAVTDQEAKLLRCFMHGTDCLSEQEVKRKLLDIDGNANMRIVKGLLYSLIDKEILVLNNAGKLSIANSVLKYCLSEKLDSITHIRQGA